MSREEEKKKIINRLKTIKGHIAGIENMVEEEKACEQILIQIAAIKSSVNKVGLAILEHNAEECLLAKTSEGVLDEQEIRKVIKTFVNFSK